MVEGLPGKGYAKSFFIQCLNSYCLKLVNILFNLLIRNAIF